MRSDLLLALRNLARNPRYAAVAILSIALGVAATTAIFSFVHSIVLAPLPFPQPERLIAIQETDRGRPAGGNPLRLADWLQAPSLEKVAAYYGGSFTVSIGDLPERISGIRTFGDLPGTLDLAPAYGRTWTTLEARGLGGNVVLMSDSLWRRKFAADRALVGRSIQINGESYVVTGILQPSREFDGADLIAPEINPQFPRSARFLSEIGRLRPGATLDQVRTELQSVAVRLRSQYPETDAEIGASALPLQEEMATGARTPLLVLLGAVGFVLLMACLNVANLSLARNAARRHEFAVRRALGAGTWRLMRLLLGESMLVASIGGLLGAGIAAWALEFLVAQAPPELPRLTEVKLNGAVLTFGAAITVLSGLITGQLPAFRFSTAGSQEVLRSEGRATTRGRARQALVAAQVALSVTLLVGGGLLFRTLWNLESQPAGFAPEHLVTFRLSLPWQMEPAQVHSTYSRVLERLAALPGVSGAALTDRLPFEGAAQSSEVIVAGRAPASLAAGSRIDLRSVSTNYQQVIGAALQTGRWLSGDDFRVRRTVINQAAADLYFAGRNPIGERIGPARKGKGSSTQDLYEIVGVVSNLPTTTREESARPAMYVAYTQTFWPISVFVVRTVGDPVALSETVRREVAAVNSTQAIEQLRTADQFLASRNRTPRLQAWLMGVFAAAALLLAGIGIYGVVAGSVADRRLETGIRMALGADPASVRRALVSNTLRLAGLGVMMGIALSALLARMLKGVLFGVSAADPASYALASTMLLAVAAASAWWPARQAASISPASVLRREN